MVARLKSLATHTLRLGVAGFSKFKEDNCTQIAAGLSYYTLFAIVPLAVLTLVLMSLILGSDRVQERLIEKASGTIGANDVSIHLEDDALSEISATHGPEAVAKIDAEVEEINAAPEAKEQRADIAAAVDAGETVTLAGYELQADQIDIRLEGVFPEAIRSYAGTKSALPVISIVLLAFSSSLVFSAYSRALNFIWKVRILRPMIQQKAIDVASLIAAFILLLASIVVSGAIGGLRSSVTEATGGAFEPVGDIVWSLLLFFVPLMVSFAFCLFAYAYLPRKNNRLRDVWPGALIGAIGFEALKFGYVIYISYFSSYDEAYGAFGAVLMLLFFVYLSAYLFLMGAEVACMFPAVRDGTYEAPVKPATASTGRAGIIGALVAAVVGLFILRERD